MKIKKMAKKETPIMSFTKAEANYIKKIAGLQLTYFEKISKEEIKKDKNIKIAKSMDELKVGMRMPASEQRKINLYTIKADKSRNLLIEEPNFIFGKEGCNHTELLYEFNFNLILSNHDKKTKTKTTILEKLDLLLEQLPQPTFVASRLYFDKM